MVCPDLKLAALQSNYVGPIPCEETNVPLIRDGSYVVKPRRGNTLLMQEIPYVISPRFTFLVTGQPLLRWNPTRPGGEPYQVRVQGGSVDWKVTVEDSQVVYPDTAPPLSAGVPYVVSVTDSQGHSSKEEKAQIDLSFGLLQAEQMKSYQAIQKRVEAMSLKSLEARDLVVVEVNITFGLRADAIRDLEKLTSKASSPWIHLHLAELYRDIGLYEESLPASEAARKAFIEQKNLAGEAQSLLLSGLSTQELEDNEEAKRLFAESLGLFTRLGDSEQAAFVESLLK